MPLPLLAHQAPILPLKLWRPSLFNGTALVIGSVGPDLAYIVDASPAAHFGHTMGAQFYFCLPITMLAVLVIGGLDLGTAVAARFARLRWLSGAATDVTKSGGLWRALASTLIGSFSHLGLDALTRDWIPRFLPARTYHLAHVSMWTSTVVQLVASVLFALLSLWALRRMWMRNASVSVAPRPGVMVLVAFAVLGVALAVRQAWPALQHPDWYFDAGRLYVWGHTAFFVACGVVGGVLVGAVPLWIWDRSSRHNATVESIRDSR